MPDDNIPEYVNKRLRYFNNQFLQEEDFTEEQNYHIDRQRRHNRLLHTPGVPDGGGLDVIKIGDTQVRVDKGTAIDGQGRQILLSDSRSVDVKDDEGKPFQQGDSVYLVISYSVQPSDRTTVGGEGETRWLESPEIKCYHQNRVPTDEDINLRLAQLKIGEGGKIDEINTKIRKIAGGKTAFSTDSIDESLLKPTIRAKLVTNGDQHDHSSGDGKGGGKIKHNNLDLGNDKNPHKTTAADVEALSLRGGTVKGTVAIEPPGRLDVFSRTFIKANVKGVYNPQSGTPSEQAIGDKGSVLIVNTSNEPSYGLVAKVSDSENDVPQTKQIPPAAVVAIANRQGTHGIYATANAGTAGLFVDGFARITGGVNPGHIVDTFINASGRRLETGDVVKLKGTPVTRFQGSEKKIPIAEVTLANGENDTLVIGVVDCKAFPEDEAPNTGVKLETFKFIEDREELYLVTLGVFALCKADATFVPIEVGDLLTTSNNPGYAQKAIQPKLGTIIGKALEPLEKGTGYISVFVNIQ